jgi:hypothetical protein
VTWTVREDEAELAADPAPSPKGERGVKGYQRVRNGRPETVHPYQRMWWIPHPDWMKGQQRWITAGEAAWKTHEAPEWSGHGEPGGTGRSGDRAAESGAPAGEPGKPSRPGGTGRSGAPAGDAADVDVVGKGTMYERPVHGYERPDPERLVRPPRKGSYSRPEDHPFFQAHPVSPENLVKAYDGTTPGEKYQGRRWYPDGYRLAWVLGGGDAEKGAKVLSAYSPRAGWPLNMHNAARALAEGRPLKKGEGIFMDVHTGMAEKAFAGKDFDEVFNGSKTNAFARLLATGMDDPEDPLGRVVVDTHALSAAVGGRLPKEEAAKAPLTEPFYSHVADQYRIAAADISERDGEEISPSELQAVVWLRQQRLNEAAEKAAAAAGVKGAGGALGLQTSMRNTWGKWEAYAREHGLSTVLGTTALPPAYITEAEARGNSREVDPQEFLETAQRGRDLLSAMAENSSEPKGLVDNWEALRSQAYQAAREPWGGVTIDAHTGEVLAPDEDKFALTAKPAGVTTISVPQDATEAQFDKAMDQALKKFGPLLERGNHHLGVFHDDDNSRIDIDPVVVVGSQDEAESIGAYTHNIGGAYRFSDGNGYFPPHVKSQSYVGSTEKEAEAAEKGS